MRAIVNSTFIWSLFLLTPVLAKAQIASQHTFSVDQVSENQIIINRLALTDAGTYKVVDSYPADTLDGPWTEQGARIHLSASEMANEQLRKDNPPKPNAFSKMDKKSALLEATKNYNFDIKKDNPCHSIQEEMSCPGKTPTYTMYLIYKRQF